MKDPDLNLLNDQLLSPEAEHDEVKRNSKEDIIRKILACCEDSDIELQHSDTKLRRMTKHQLLKLLAEVLQEKVRNDMAEQVGAKRGAVDSVIALGALKMVHSIAANTAEKGLNVFLPTYGYHIDGFCESLNTPPVDKCVDACLAEIAAETDVLQYVESPYARLAIAWSGALLASLKKIRRVNVINNAARMESRPAHAKNPVQPRAGRREENGQNRGRRGSVPANVLSV